LREEMYSPLSVHEYLDMRDLNEKIETISVQIDFGLYANFFTDTLWYDSNDLV